MWDITGDQIQYHSYQAYCDYDDKFRLPNWILDLGYPVREPRLPRVNILAQGKTKYEAIDDSAKEFNFHDYIIDRQIN